jgi:fructose-bisphosphate aldolase class I
MNAVDLERTARDLVAEGKGILAADETPETLTKRFAQLKIPSTPDSRRQYREIFFTTPDAGQFISGVIMQDETIRQKSSAGRPFADVLIQNGIIPGIKVDTGAKGLAGRPGESITEGLDGLRDRLKEYHQIGARFAKWRAVIHIADGFPTSTCVLANAHALARYAALCQEQGFVPIVEPEVLMDGSHGIRRCEEVTGNVLEATIEALFEHSVSFEGMLLKPNMILAGKEAPRQASVPEVALCTVRCLRRHVPAAVPGVVFLSGGQDPLTATIHLNAINQLDGLQPWKLSFSFGRALQDETLQEWNGKQENVQSAQHAFSHRAKCASAAAVGNYATEMEGDIAA